MFRYHLKEVSFALKPFFTIQCRTRQPDKRFDIVLNCKIQLHGANASGMIMVRNVGTKFYAQGRAMQRVTTNYTVELQLSVTSLGRVSGLVLEALVHMWQHLCCNQPINDALCNYDPNYTNDPRWSTRTTICRHWVANIHHYGVIPKWNRNSVNSCNLKYELGSI